jgi:hypothetical protein
MAQIIARKRKQESEKKNKVMTEMQEVMQEQADIEMINI